MRHKAFLRKENLRKNTRGELISKIHRLHSRISALETSVNHETLRIKNGILEFEKTVEGRSKKFKDRLYFWCVVERIGVLGKEIKNVETKTLYFVDDEEGGKYYLTEEETNGEEFVKIERFEYPNLVNIFLTKKEAERHVSAYRKKYTKPEVLPIFPIENKEMEIVFQSFRSLGEVFPDFDSVWEKARTFDELLEQLEEKKKEASELNSEIRILSEKLSESEKEKEAILQTIQMKKGRK